MLLLSFLGKVKELKTEKHQTSNEVGPWFSLKNRRVFLNHRNRREGYKEDLLAEH